MNKAVQSYTIVLEPGEAGGYVVTVPALPELATQGWTEQEAIANEQEMIAEAIGDRRHRGEPIPADVVPRLLRVDVSA